jgi:hypothetical protein
MEESDSTSRMTPYELATLASRIDPERCVRDPKEAIAAAERLLEKAEAAIDRVYQEERSKEWELEEAQMPRMEWIRALKEITGQKRKDRAVHHFRAYMEREEPQYKQALNQYKRDGFPVAELLAYQELFRTWLKEPKHKKGKQGRRRSEHDGRLRTQLVGLVPTKPRKRG